MASQSTSQSTGTADNKATHTESAEVLSKARREAEEFWPVIGLPKGASKAPVSDACTTSICEAKRVQFVRNDWPKAWRGDHQGQVNAAFCRRTGCNGAVVIDKVDACAWRLVVARSRSSDSGDMDARNLKTDCGDLDQFGLEAAQSRAQGYVAGPA
jgi:hypothetical protein